MTRMIRSALTRRALAAAALLPLAAPAVVRAQAADPAWFDQWDQVLRRFVDAEGRVDFAGVAAASQPLRAIVATIGATGPQNAPAQFPTREHVLAYHCNAYNALAMLGIVDRGIPTSLTLLGRLTFFTGTTMRIAGRDTNLKSYEDDVIRTIGEERIHFALNCMVRGCPRLPQESFRAARLEAQFAAAAREFCESAYHVRPDLPARTVRVSQIFDFFTRDFVPAKAPSLLAYVNRWRTNRLPDDLALRFFDYDWTINRQPPRTGAAG